MKLRIGLEHYVRRLPSRCRASLNTQAQLRALIARELRGHVTQSKAYWNDTATNFFNDLPAATRREFRGADEFTNLVRIRRGWPIGPLTPLRRSTMK